MIQQQVRFNLGGVYMTRGVSDRVADDEPFAKFVHQSLERHARGDWGFLCDEDRRLNDQALLDGRLRLFSAYLPHGNHADKIWIITEADRSATTILFPDEY